MSSILSIPFFRELFEKYPELELPVMILLIGALAILLAVTGLANGMIMWVQRKVQSSVSSMRNPE